MNLTNITKLIKEKYNPQNTLIIGIDGLGGAGKSTISAALTELLSNENYNITLLHIDDFIHPKSVRYNDSYAAWECYYNLQWRYDYLINEIVMPIKNGSKFNKNIELYDKDNDTYLLKNTVIPLGSIVLIEGIFLQRQELSDIFDYMIYIDIPEDIRLERVLKRDGYIGSRQQIKDKYNNRYFPAEHYYIENCLPHKKADYIIKD